MTYTEYIYLLKELWSVLLNTQFFLFMFLIYNDYYAKKRGKHVFIHNLRQLGAPVHILSQFFFQ